MSQEEFWQALLFALGSGCIKWFHRWTLLFRTLNFGHLEKKGPRHCLRITKKAMTCQCNSNITKIDMGKTKDFQLSGKILWHLKSDERFLWICKSRVLIMFWFIKIFFDSLGFLLDPGEDLPLRITWLIYKGK